MKLIFAVVCLLTLITSHAVELDKSFTSLYVNYSNPEKCINSITVHITDNLEYGQEILESEQTLVNEDQEAKYPLWKIIQMLCFKDKEVKGYSVLEIDGHTIELLDEEKKNKEEEFNKFLVKGEVDFFYNYNNKKHVLSEKSVLSLKWRHFTGENSVAFLHQDSKTDYNVSTTVTRHTNVLGVEAKQTSFSSQELNVHGQTNLSLGLAYDVLKNKKNANLKYSAGFGPQFSRMNTLDDDGNVIGYEPSEFSMKVTHSIEGSLKLEKLNNLELKTSLQYNHGPDSFRNDMSLITTTSVNLPINKNIAFLTSFNFNLLNAKNDEGVYADTESTMIQVGVKANGILSNRVIKKKKAKKKK